MVGARGASMALAGELSATFFLSQYGLVLAAAGLILSLWGGAGLAPRGDAAAPVRGGRADPLLSSRQACRLRLQLLSSDTGVSILQRLAIAAHNDGNIIDLGPVPARCRRGVQRPALPLSAGRVVGDHRLSLPWPNHAPKLLAILAAAADCRHDERAADRACRDPRRPRAAADAAEGFLHLFEGWVIFLLCALLLVWPCSELANRFVRPRVALLDRFGLAPPLHRRAATPASGEAFLPPRDAVAASIILAVAGGADRRMLRLRPDRTPPHPHHWRSSRCGSATGAGTAMPLARLPRRMCWGIPTTRSQPIGDADGAIANLFIAYYGRQEEGPGNPFAERVSSGRRLERRVEAGSIECPGAGWAAWR